MTAPLYNKDGQPLLHVSLETTPLFVHSTDSQPAASETREHLPTIRATDMTVKLTHSNWNEFVVALSVLLGSRGTAIVITDDKSYTPSAAAYQHYCDAARTAIYANISDDICSSLNSYAQLSTRDLWIALESRFKPRGAIVLQRGINNVFLEGRSPAPVPLNIDEFERWAACTIAAMDQLRGELPTLEALFSAFILSQVPLLLAHISAFYSTPGQVLPSVETIINGL